MTGKANTRHNEAFPVAKRLQEINVNNGTASVHVRRLRNSEKDRIFALSQLKMSTSADTMDVSGTMLLVQYQVRAAIVSCDGLKDEDGQRLLCLFSELPNGLKVVSEDVYDAIHGEGDLSAIAEYATSGVTPGESTTSSSSPDGHTASERDTSEHSEGTQDQDLSPVDDVEVE